MNEVIMELKNITKYFPGVVALDNMSFTVRKGMVHGLIGENGAGKSTLIKVFTGVNQPDKGEIYIDGKQVHLSNPMVAKAAGVGCVYQELNIVQELNVTDNLFINYYKKKGILLDYKAMHARAREIMEEMGQPVDPRTECGKLGLGVQQTIEIGKSILSDARLIIMDEPTSSLSESEVKQLFKTIEMLKNKGISIMTKDLLIAHMVGRSLDNLFPKEVAEKREEMLRVEHLNSAGVLYDVSFKAYGGQILGFSGLVGAGRTETMRAIFGADIKDSGDIYIRGEKVDIKSPKDAIHHRIGFLTEDRKGEGLILIDSVLHNLHLATID